MPFDKLGETVFFAGYVQLAGFVLKDVIFGFEEGLCFIDTCVELDSAAALGEFDTIGRDTGIVEPFLD